MYDLSGGQVPWSQQQAWQDGAGAKPLLREVLDAANQQRRSQSLPSLVEMEIQAGIDMLDMAIGACPGRLCVLRQMAPTRGR